GPRGAGPARRPRRRGGRPRASPYPEDFLMACAGNRRGGGGGFTLLEVLLAVAILAISLTSLLSSQMAALRATRYARGVSVAAFLAESKLIDIEWELRKDGWGDNDKEFEGDFSEEGWPDARYTCLVDMIELPDY